MNVQTRQSLRLKNYDYRNAGSYFVTICAQQRACIFGEIKNGNLLLTEAGALAQRVWAELPTHYPNVKLDEFVVMPNHMHGIVTLKNPATSLSEIVRAFKTFAARHINTFRGTQGMPVWQRNYYERVIRDENEFLLIREYIRNNPLQWALDEENPERI